MVRFDCPACGKRLKCQPNWVGLVLICPACEARVQIPAEDGGGGWVPADEVDPVTAYQLALAELDRLANVTDQAALALRQAASRLYSWRDFVPDEEDGRPVVRNRSGDIIAAGTWLSSDALRQMIADWHAARDAAHRAWAELPRERRFGLKPPP